jgi:hypothetical protein
MRVNHFADHQRMPVRAELKDALELAFEIESEPP